MSKAEEWLRRQDKATLAALGLMTVTAVVLFAVLVAGMVQHDDGKPDWADRMAGQLDEKGGMIYYYGNATSGSWSGSTPVYRIDVTVGETVYANAQGIVVKTGNSITQIPYDRVYSIHIAS